MPEIIFYQKKSASSDEKPFVVFGYRGGNQGEKILLFVLSFNNLDKI